MANETLVASAARTASGTGTPLAGMGLFKTIRAQLDVTASAGTTPSLDVVLEDTVDGTNWNTIATFAQRVAAAREVVNITLPFADQVRARWTIAGTGPSFTFTVDAYTE